MSADQGFEDFLLARAFQNRRIYVWGEINDLMAASVIDQLYLHYEMGPNLPVHLLINSEGGSVTACEAMIDEMQILKQKGFVINTICVGMAASAAGVILAMGTKGFRYVRPNSTVMLHPVSFGLESDYIDQQKKMTNFFEEKTNLMNALIANVLDKCPKKYAKEIKDGLWMTSDKAVKYGVVDSVNTEPLPCYPEYKYD